MKTEIWTRPDPAGFKKCLYRGYVRFSFTAFVTVQLDAELPELGIRSVVVQALPGLEPVQLVTVNKRPAEIPEYAEAPAWDSILPAPAAAALDAA